MSLRYRLLKPEDVSTCAEIIARHPIHGPRYGESIRDLLPIWLELLRCEGCLSIVFEEDSGARTVVLGGALDTFVTEEFADELRKPPHFWIGPEIVRRIRAGRSPVLNDKQVCEANSSGGGLIAVVWHTGLLPHHLANPEIGNGAHRAFNDIHSGYYLGEVLVQGECQAHLEALCAIGVHYWNGGEGRYELMNQTNIPDLLDHSHLLGASRQLAERLSGYWAAATFLYQPPRFGFSRSEQRLLSTGLSGGTDSEIASELGVSLDVVRKNWRNIYERVAAIDPGLLPYSTSQYSGSSERGKAKKQRLLAYVSNHPEELRPVSRKLLGSPTTRRVV